MGKRTPQAGLEDWDEAQLLDDVVIDKRHSKRAGRAKARRRDRRYENRLLRTTLETQTPYPRSEDSVDRCDPIFGETNGSGTIDNTTN